MKSITLFFLLSMVLPFLHAEDASDQHYVFLSGVISAKIKDQFVPINSFDGKRLNFDGAAKSTRPTARMSCSMQPVVAISNLYVDINEWEYSFSSMEANLRSLQVINQMNSEQMRFEAANEFSNSQLGGDFQDAQSDGDDVGASEIARQMTAGDNAVQALNDLTYDQIIDEIREVGSFGLRDTINGRCSIVSDRQIDNAYGAIVLSFREANAQKRLQGIRRSVVRIFPVGNIQPGVANRLKFTCSFPELRLTDTKLDVFLFDGNGQHVATNRSRAIKEITAEQLEKFRELEKIEPAG